MSWYWIALELTVPPIVALAVAFPFWRRRQMTFGSIVGTAVIFAAGIGLILREYVELDRVTQACLDAGGVCWAEPGAFTRFAIYASIAMAEVFALFTAGLFAEERVRRRDYAPEWR